MDYQFQQLEKKSIYIIREARMKSEKVVLLCLTDRDSVLLSFLCQKAFFGKTPFRIIKESELEKNNSDEVIWPLASWKENDIKQYIKQIKRSETDQYNGDKDEEKEDIMKRLRELGYM